MITGNQRLECCCGWIGTFSQLRKVECLTDADEWYACPKCGEEAFNMRKVKDEGTGTDC